MSFNRRISQTQGLFVSPTGVAGVTGVAQISRVQSVNDGWELNRQNVNQFGQLAALSREIVDAPTVNLSFSYYVTDGADEERLGFDIDGVNGALTNILDKTQSEKNYYIPTVPEGEDLAGEAVANIVDTRAIGNGFVSSYSVEGSVGGFLTANVSVEASNAAYHLGGSGNPNPAIDPLDGDALPGTYTLPVGVTGDAGQPIVLKQGDLSLNFGSIDTIGAMLTGVGAAHIQSFNLNIPMGREQLQRLGNRYAYDRPLTFPIDVTLSVSAFVNQLNTGSLAELYCGDSKHDISIVANNSCIGGGTAEMVYTLKGATLDAESFTSSIGPAQTVDLTFTASVGGPNDAINNILFSGSA
jgi:hypothetical protein